MRTMGEYARNAGIGREAAPRCLTSLSRTEALRLLGTVPLGRIVFTHRALPAVRPVNHCLDGDDVIVGIHDGAALVSLTAPAGGPGLVVAYEADAIDPDTRLGWSVVVTGYARPVTDPGLLDRYRTVLRPWVTGGMDHALSLRPGLVTGFRLTVGPPTASPGVSAPVTAGTPGEAVGARPSR
ncbi:pyridoxamine 5'-phosphate oxidase family protein [Streptomyces lavendofoliae]|uniref:pyridoxamine 5'-phosphate oxidase family protein n=1 Tax=Streptomyces lavendofoliae TaxID=67314 RepID=UPI003D8F2786